MSTAWKRLGLGTVGFCLPATLVATTIGATTIGATTIGAPAMATPTMATPAMAGAPAPTTAASGARPATKPAPTVLTSSAASASGSATEHGMRVTGAFLPLPASPSVASAYLTLHNLTGKADTLVSIATSVASSSMAMSEGASSMQMLGPVTVPAHGSVTFTPGHDHLMLQGLKKKLAVGQKVDVRLRFRRAGTVSVEIPVVPLARILGNQASDGPTGSRPAPGAKGAKATGGGSTKGTAPTTMGHMAGT